MKFATITVVLTLAAYTVYSLASADAWIGAILVAFFAAAGITDHHLLQKAETTDGARHVLGWVLAAQLLFAFLAGLVAQ